jgi:hypothetical protein
VYDSPVLRRILPPWLRRGVEAGVVGAFISIATPVAFQASRPAPRLTLPNGLDGALILTPAVVALGVLVVAYPTFLAATRSDAVLGAIAAFFVAADALLIVSFVAREAVMIHPLGRNLPLGVVAVALALPVAAAGLLVGQLTAPFGFGRSAGFRSALGGAALGLILVVAVAYTV